MAGGEDTGVESGSWSGGGKVESCGGKRNKIKIRPT